MISRFKSTSLAATRVLIEKTLKASEIERAPSAESFRPVNGNESGLLWHWLLIFNLLMLAKVFEDTYRFLKYVVTLLRQIQSFTT